MGREGVQRFKEIVRVFAHYGVEYLLYNSSENRKTSPKALYKAFKELGATFIKIGQVLSTRPDLLSDEYIKELEKLQDSNSYTDFYKVKNIFYDEFGDDLNKHFLYFEKKPFASASIAQVHRAKLLDGRCVVVKVQHWDIEKKMKLDLGILRRILKVAKARLDVGIIDPIKALNEIEIATLKELNFIEESNNMIRFKELNKDVECVTSPIVIENLSSKRILTMEEIKGFKITNTDTLKKDGYDRDDVGKKLALSFCKQVFDDGFFHGDPHPGNLLIADGKIAYIDFGIMGELPNYIKKWINKAVISMGTNNIDGLIDFVMAVGTTNGRVKTNMLYEDFQLLLNKYLGVSLSSIKISEMFSEIFYISNSHNIMLPQVFVSLVRAMIILEGVVAQLSPDLQIIEVIISFIKSKAENDLFNKLNIDDIKYKLYKFTTDGIKIPAKIIELVDGIAKGRAKVQVEMNELKLFVFQLHKMINRISFAVVVGCMIIASALVLSSKAGPEFRGLPVIGLAGYVISAIFGLWLLISIIKSGFF